jgi:hypothetical protein
MSVHHIKTMPAQKLPQRHDEVQMQRIPERHGLYIKAMMPGLCTQCALGMA